MNNLPIILVIVFLTQISSLFVWLLNEDTKISKQLKSLSKSK